VRLVSSLVGAEPAAARRYDGAEKRVKERMAVGRRERQRGDDKQREYAGFERRIKAEVEAGKMTREEAREKLEDYKRNASADDGKQLDTN